MKAFNRWVLVIAGLAAASVLPAQVAEFNVHGGVSRLSNNQVGSIPPQQGSPRVFYSLEDGWRLGFRLTLNNWRFFGNEFGYAYNRSKLGVGVIEGQPVQEQGMAIHQGFYNFLVYATPEGSRIRPFATGGGHFSNFTPPGASATWGGGSTKFGFNYGGGIKVRVSPIFLVRADFRQYQTGKPFELQNVPSGLIRQTEVSVGFSFVL